MRDAAVECLCSSLGYVGWELLGFSDQADRDGETFDTKIAKLREEQKQRGLQEQELERLQNAQEQGALATDVSMRGRDADRSKKNLGRPLTLSDLLQRLAPGINALHDVEGETKKERRQRLGGTSFAEVAMKDAFGERFEQYSRAQ